MFSLESQMTVPVLSWMASLGLHVQREFQTPWGHCDLVGLKFRKRNVEHRLKLRQTKPVGSLFRVGILLEIPDSTLNSPVSVSELTQHFPYVEREQVETEIDRLVDDKFVIRDEMGQLSKVNGWDPLGSRLLAVELKLTRIDEVMRQARSNLSFATESYVALPKATADRVNARREQWQEHFANGVGLVSVTDTCCEVLIKSRNRNLDAQNAQLRFHCTEKLWRSYLKGN